MVKLAGNLIIQYKLLNKLYFIFYLKYFREYELQ